MLFLALSSDSKELIFMKKFVLVLALMTGLSSTAQFGPVFNDWLITGGFNAVNDLGTRNPFASPGDWYFKTPFSFSGEKQFDRDWTIEIAININGLNEGDRSDPVTAPENLTYFSLDTNVKYYFGRQIFRRGFDKVDFYAASGLGFFTIDDTNASFNFGGGVLWWVDEFNTMGIRLQAIAKFAFNNSDSGFANNHFQYGLHFVWRLPK